MLVTFQCKQLANLFIAEAGATPSTFVSGFQQFQLLHNFPNKDVSFPEGGGDLINLLPSSEPGFPEKVPVDCLGLAKLLTNQARMLSFTSNPTNSLRVQKTSPLAAPPLCIKALSKVLE